MFLEKCPEVFPKMSRGFLKNVPRKIKTRPQLFSFLLYASAINEKIRPFKKESDSYLFELFWEMWVVMDSNHRRHSQQIYSLQIGRASCRERV